nr:MAG TPA: baseplate protein [Caudoviricetes sp.]
MDLIYTNADREDIGVLKDYTFDLAFGSSENDFECKVYKENHCCLEDYFLYIDGTEYGGIIDSIGVADDEITYSGRTWHGILNSKILEPDSGQDYLILNGEANTVLGQLIGRMGLNSLFKASAETSGITINNYKMNRYIKGYDGIIKMLKAFGGKLNIKFNKGFVELSAKPIVDYSQNEQFNSDLIDFDVTKNYNPINHCICLGKGDLAKREVIHIYADRNGNISENQVFTGLEEVTAIYENVNAEGDKLKSGGIEVIQNSWAADKLDFDFNADDESYDIGDIVGAREEITETTAKREITKKIVTIKNNDITISYPTDTTNKSGGSVTGSSGSGFDVDKIYPVGSIYLSVSSANPTDLFGGTWERIQDRFLLAAGSSYAAGRTGGEATHKLTVKEMPSHNHRVYILAKGYSEWGHEQKYAYQYSFSSWSNPKEYSGTNADANTCMVLAGDTTSTGSSSPHNNMPPYLAVYVWKRTA